LEQLRARIGRRHGLAQEAQLRDPEEISNALVGLHGTDPASMFLSAAVRQAKPRFEDLVTALYETRTLARILGMRRTVFAVTRELVPVLLAAYRDRHGKNEGKRVRIMLQSIAEGQDVEALLADFGDRAVAAIGKRGEATASQVAADVPALQARMVWNEGKKYEGSQSVASRLMLLLAIEGRIVRARPRGGITSNLYRWARTADWLPDVDLQWDAASARTRLIERYLARYGPATEGDVAWWTGLPVGMVRSAMAELEVEATPHGFVLAGDAAPVEPPAPWAALLPALDPTAMGWTDRSRFLDPADREALFDRSGNIGPTVWVNGRIVGGWAQRASGAIAFRLLHRVSAADRERIDERVEELRRLLGDLRFVPRFRTPLEREVAVGG